MWGSAADALLAGARVPMGMAGSGVMYSTTGSSDCVSNTFTAASLLSSTK